MIEQAMFLALGASLAGLVALLILPAISRRASRLARADLERQMPLSAGEIVAQRDLLRAEFAAERRRLEQAHDAASEAHALERAEAGRRTVEASRLSGALAVQTAAREAAQGDRDDAVRRMREAEAESAALQKALYDADGLEVRLRASAAGLSQDRTGLEQALAQARTDIAKLRADGERSATQADDLERALMQARLDLSLARAHGETQGAQIDAHDERMRMAAATESELRLRLAALERVGAAGGDLDVLRRTIVEIGREVVRLAARQAAAQEAVPRDQPEPRAPVQMR